MKRIILAALAATLPLLGQQAYHQLEVIPSSSGTAGELRFVETTGWTSGTGTNYVGFKPPASIGTNVVWSLPATDSSGTQCLSSNGSGVLAWSACSAGSTLPVVDTTSVVEGSADATKELRFEVDGFATATVRTLTPQNANYIIAGTNISNTFTSNQTFSGHIQAGSDAVYDVGSKAVRFAVGGFSTLNAVTFETTATVAGVPDDAIFWKNTATVGGGVNHDYFVTSPGANNLLRLSDYSGTKSSQIYGSLVVDGSLYPSTSTQSLGLPGANSWQTVYADRVIVSASVEPQSAGLDSVGTLSVPFGDVYADDYTVNIGITPDTSGGAFIGTSGTRFGTSYFTTLNVSAGLALNSSSVTTSAAGVSDLGTAALYLDDLYIDDIHVQARILPDLAVGVSAIGSTVDPFNDIYSDDVFVNEFLKPDIDNGADIGTPTLRFNNVYAVAAEFEGTVTVDNLTNGNTIPALAEIGSTATPFGTVYTSWAEIDIYVRADTDGGADLGTSTVGWKDFYIEDRMIGNQAGVSFPVATMTVVSGGPTEGEYQAFQFDSMKISSGGSFYNRNFSAGDLDCNPTNPTAPPANLPVDPGWNGFRTDTNELQWCAGSGATARLIPSVTISDTPSNLTCGASQVITNATVINGIITGGTCTTITIP